MNRRTFTVKTFMIIASAFMVVVYFLPMVQANTSNYLGFNLGISAMTFTFGMPGGGSEFGGLGLCIIMLLIPCVLTVLWIFRADGYIAVISLALSVAVAVMYLFFAAMLGLITGQMGSYAQGMMGITAWLVIAVIVSLLMVVFSFMLAINKMTVNTGFGNLSGRAARGTAGAANYNYSSYSAVPPQNRQEGEVCPACGTVLPAGTRFCRECGTPIVQKKICPGCGAEMNADALFCKACGMKQ